MHFATDTSTTGLETSRKMIDSNICRLLTPQGIVPVISNIFLPWTAMSSSLRTEKKMLRCVGVSLVSVSARLDALEMDFLSPHLVSSGRIGHATRI